MNTKQAEQLIDTFLLNAVVNKDYTAQDVINLLYTLNKEDLLDLNNIDSDYVTDNHLFYSVKDYAEVNSDYLQYYNQVFDLIHIDSAFGDGDTGCVVFKLLQLDQYLRVEYVYRSYSGNSFIEAKVVTPQTKLITVYE